MIAPRRTIGLRSGLIALVVLTVLMATALSGVLGGNKAAVLHADSPDATLSVRTPLTLRSGLFFEQTIAVVAKRPLSDLVIAVEPAIWRDITINSLVPAASDEEFKDGAFRYHFGPLQPGEAFTFKIDGQVNPPLTAGTKGMIGAADGDRSLAAIPIAIKVLP